MNYKGVKVGGLVGLSCSFSSVLHVYKARPYQSNTSEINNIFQKNWSQALFEVSVLFWFLKIACQQINFE